jgi:hypothetical protein
LQFFYVIAVLLCPLPVFAGDPPFGFYETPDDGSTVNNTIPVTGWALDDEGVESVKIYREKYAGEGSGLVLIGDAVFVQGARPDVAEAYPEYPNNDSAGWGYMLLTNALPDGACTLHAIVKDVEGNSVVLGTKTITIDNASSVKPFGSLDTPQQGGTASGSDYIVWGWVLTPQPNTIPFDGSSIFLWVDGVNLGNPVYDIYREDIATLFPGYNNSNGAVFYFYLNTTNYTDGLHAISVTAKDDAGNTDGIGNRYFTIDNVPDESLPVSLSQFNAKAQFGHILLSWETESETDNVGFMLERFKETRGWTVIASYQTTELLMGQGNSAARTEYEFKDLFVEHNRTYLYRLSDVDCFGNKNTHPAISAQTGVIPEETKMEPAFPNPFNPNTSISYSLADYSDVTIAVYDMLGRTVKTLVKQDQHPGNYQVSWNGIDINGEKAPSALYIIRMQTENYFYTQKVMLVK